LEFSLGLNGVCWVEDGESPSGCWSSSGGRPAGCVEEVAWQLWPVLTCGMEVQVLFW